VPPHVGSRYSFSTAVEDENGRLYLTSREPYRFTVQPDTRIHRVTEGDTLFSLAGRYFEPLPRACGYWWAIADFQRDDPILDPTLELEIGRLIYVPSLRVLTDVVLADPRGGRR
jgi:hypothetical protein